MALAGGTRSLFFPIAVFRDYVSSCGAWRVQLYFLFIIPVSY